LVQHILLVLFLFGAAFAQSIPTDSCSLCNVVVDGLEKYLLLHTAKTQENLLAGITKIKDNVCPNLPVNAYLTSQQCTDYLRLYGPYVVELFVANSDPSKICGSLGFCQDIGAPIIYNMIFPTITDESVEYIVPFTKMSLRGEQEFYKIFLGHPAFATEEMLFVELLRKDREACSIAMEVTNKTKYLHTIICDKNTTNCKCNDPIPHPGRGVWYYITLTSVQMSNQSRDCSFSLRAMVHNIPRPAFFAHARWSILAIILPVLCCLSLCCCCCCLRRKCRKAGGCRWSRGCKKEVALDMQPMGVQQVQQVQQEAAPIGYYYVPSTFAGQYMPVPQGSQPMVYPQFIPVTQE